MSANLSIAETGRELRAGRLSSAALVEEALARIMARDGDIHAFIAVQEDAARAAAAEADRERAAGIDRGALHGIPYAIKDIYDVAGLPTTCHSRLRLDHRTERDSAVVERLRAAGAILLGKLATHEFAFGGPSSDLPFPPARNPWNTAHIPGGSSSGSAAAVAAGYVRFAPGSCTGGSIRGPAAWCGVVGLKPTYGRVSRRGVFPLAWSLDHCGPLAATVEDAAIVLQAMAGHDPLDPASAERQVPDFVGGLDRGVAGLTVGVPRAFFEGHALLAPETAAAIERALDGLRAAGATVRDITLPELKLFGACGRVLMTAELFAIHGADLRARPGDYGALTLNRFALGATLTASDYLNAQRLRRRLKAAVDSGFDEVDIMLTAISLDTAPAFDPPPNPAAWALQANAFNVTGHPAVSVPAGVSSGGLPLAVQLVAPHFQEAELLSAARVLESCSSLTPSLGQG